MRILFLGETYRADAQTWIKGIEKASGIKLETKELPKTGGRAARIIKAFGFLLSLGLSKKQYDITLAERATSYGFFSLLVKSKVRIVAQQGISDAFPETGFAGWYKRILQRAIYTRADLIHAWGYVMTYAMLESGAAPSRILVKPKGLNLNLFRYFSERSEAFITAVVTRSLYDIYRHHEILEALAILRKKGIIVHCIMIGDGAEKEKLIDQTSSLGLGDQVHWMGRVPNDELPLQLAKAQLYIAIPETEGVSASLFEAMACGCFPIVTDLPANRAFITSGQNGLLVQVGNPQDLAQKIELYTANPSRFSPFLQSNRKFIEKNCNLEVNMKEFYLTYQKLINQK
ncbi:glycosyltransferase [Algoriphagus lacus]|uniref:Glycosyltransferase n=1 Tax=Algoriphagus lacus TaxID=2056311 RepID=A0A418PLS2_9BACT|nr:glycosyltransferase [Algoriphagus lacus]RIW12258.1 glycosyltransferase [Algoriphagus lacus]